MYSKNKVKKKVIVKRKMQPNVHVKPALEEERRASDLLQLCERQGRRVIFADEVQFSANVI